MFMPKATWSPLQPRKRPASAFAPARIASTARPVAYGAPRFPEASRSARAIASPTSSGTCVPPGASRKANPERREEKRDRAASTSKTVVVTGWTAPGCVRPDRSSSRRPPASVSPLKYRARAGLPRRERRAAGRPDHTISTRRVPKSPWGRAFIRAISRTPIRISRATLGLATRRFSQTNAAR